LGNIFGRVFMQRPGRGRVIALGTLAVGLGFYLAHPHFFTPGQDANKNADSTVSNVGPGQAFDLGDCTLRYLQADGAKSGTIQIARDGVVLFKQQTASGTFNLLTTEGADNSRNIYTAPLNAAGERDIVAEVTSAGDDHQYTVLRLSKNEHKTETPQVVAHLHTGKSTLHLLDGGKDDVFGLSCTDLLDGWGAESVSPTINYHLAGATEQNPDKARLEPVKSFVDAKLLKESSADLKEQFEGLMVSEDAPITFAPASLADEMANLIYAGHKKEALQLLDQVWPTKEPGEKKKKKNLFWSAFLKELQKSPNWAAVEKLNNGLS
jgi:hypothetical protein